jgi:hypothetical protein
VIENIEGVDYIVSGSHIEIHHVALEKAHIRKTAFQVPCPHLGQLHTGHLRPTAQIVVHKEPDPGAHIQHSRPGQRHAGAF